MMLLGCAVGRGSGSETNAEAAISLDEILERMNQSARSLKTYQCQIEYLSLQPEMFDAKTLRKGNMFYKRGSDRSYLRINFDTKKEDEFDEQVYVQYYIFDGEWLTYVNFEDKSIQKRQLAEPNHPVDAFELAQSSMPIVGFSESQDLKKEFDLSLVEPRKEDEGALHLLLKVKPESTFKDDYLTIEFWVSNTRWLPVKAQALTTEKEIYRIRFLNPKINETVSDKLFKFEAPRDFGPPEIYPLKSVAGTSQQ
jgi:outer membrane lipoprotein-sorting protein